MGMLTCPQSLTLAQLIPDNTLGSESSLIHKINELSDRIDGGAIRGTNLFHSFREFNVSEGRGVYFANPAGIANILSRVTGGNPSQILGRLGVLGGANLFLLNPKGIIFGANASLDIQGSFFATTAAGIQLGDEGFFSATNPQESRLLSVSPGALFFNQVANQAGSIINRGNLAVGKDLTLAAGNLDLQGQLGAGGNLTLQALNTVQIRDSAANPFIAAAKGNLLIQGNQKLDIFALNHPQSGLFSGGDLVLRSAKTVGGDAHFWSGGSFRIEQLDGSLGDLYSPHDPVIRANGDVVLNSYTGASLHILAGGLVYIPGTITITGVEDASNALAETVTLSDGTAIAIDGSTEPTVDIRAGTTAFGSPFVDTGTPSSSDIVLGDITFNPIFGSGGKVFLTNQYQANPSLGSLLGGIQVSAIETGDVFGGGSVTIDSRHSINLNGTVDVSGDASLGTVFGNGGDVRLLAQNNIITGASILAKGALGGDVILTSAGDVSIANGAEVNVRGGGEGRIAIAARNLELSGASQLKAGIDEGLGSADAVGGDIVIHTPGTTTIAQGSAIANVVSLYAIGQAGKIDITAGTLSVTEGGTLNTSTAGEGDAGAIKITATDRVSFEGGLAVSGVFATGKAGGLEITTPVLEVLNGGGLVASVAGEGEAGTVKITASDRVRFDGGFAFSTLEATGKGKAGGIEINTPVLEVLNGGELNASTFGEGDAGGIEITTGSLEVRNGSVLSTSVVGVGNGGVLKINAADQVVFDNSKIFNALDKEAIGNAGGIEIAAGSLEILNGTNLSTATLGQGNGGSLKINAAQTIVVDKSTVFSSLGPQGKGNAGGIEMTTGSLEVLKGGQIDASTFGEGNAGTLKITATAKASFDGGFASSGVGETAKGNAGGIEITTPVLEVLNEGQLNANTLGVGDAGTVKITAAQKVSFDGGFAASEVGDTGKGKAGGIEITTPVLEVLRGGALSASSLGQGNAGDITIQASEQVSLTGAANEGLLGGGIFAFTTNTGKAGTIAIDTPRFTISAGAQVAAFTSGSGNAGDIIISAPQFLTLGANSKLTVETSGAGKAGDITITSETLTIDKDAQLSATATATATNPQGGGSITLNTSNLNISGKLGIFAETQGQSPAGNLTLKPNNHNPNLNIRFTDNGFISASTAAAGDGGNIAISAPQVLDIRGRGNIAVGTSGSGKAGTIEMTSPTLTLADGLEISASTLAAGDAGNITLNAQQISLSQTQINAFTNNTGKAGSITVPNAQTVSLSDRSQMSASTSGVGNAGDISIQAASVILDNSSSIITAVNPGASGRGGNITLQTRGNSLTLKDGSQISSRSQGQGKAGNIEVNSSGRVSLSDSDITTSSEQTSGGAITINAQDIRLEGDSDIRTNVASGVGGGGDINLKGASILVYGDSDILAFARDGQGGNITLDTPVFFGERFQVSPSGIDPNTLDNNGRVDINASGAVSGTITLPDLNFIRNSLTDLPENLIDTENLIANSCVARNQAKAGTFVMTGSGGLPVRPGDASVSPYPTGTVRRVPPSGVPPRAWQPGDPIVEPQGAYRLANGKLVLSRECQ
jgi:filamentous hemagglutinin family protein